MSGSNTAQMFNSIAWRYDFLNHLFSCQIDRLWRRRAVRELRGIPGHMLDVATGTADLAIAISKHVNPEHVFGIDISEGMLERGRKKVEQQALTHKITLLPGSAEAIPFAESRFRAVTVAFGVRNFQNPDRGIREMHRVLREGGKIVVLEFSTPQNPLVRSIYHFYFRRILPFIGRIISKNMHAYTYLPASVQQFPHGAAFMRIMSECGFINVKMKPQTAGIACIYTGIKDTTPHAASNS